MCEIFLLPPPPPPLSRWPRLQAREYLMCYRGQVILAVVGYGSLPLPSPLLPWASCPSFSEHVFVNVYGAQESIPSAYVAWRASTTIRIAVPARQAGNRFLGSSKRPTITGSVFLCVAGQAYSTDGERGWGRSQIICGRERLVLYHPLNTLCSRLWKNGQSGNSSAGNMNLKAKSGAARKTIFLANILVQTEHFSWLTGKCTLYSTCV